MNDLTRFLLALVTPMLIYMALTSLILFEVSKIYPAQLHWVVSLVGLGCFLPVMTTSWLIHKVLGYRED